MLEAFQRIRATMTERAADHRAAQARALRRSRAAGAPRRLERRAPDRAARSTPSRAATSSFSTPSASWRRSIQVATVVFVGGSLVDAGGHNILEPAVFGKPIVFGPHMHNFAEIARTFLENGAAVQVRTAARARAGAARPARRSGAPRHASAPAARALVEANRGARGQELAAIAAAAAAARQSRQTWCRPVRRLLRAAWTPCLARSMRPSRAAAASATPRRPDLRRRLRRPVISVGNLAVGGRGKTPLVAAIARELLAMGERPAILSRGYARTQPGRRRRGRARRRTASAADLDRAGDEPLMLARRLEGVVGPGVARSVSRRPSCRTPARRHGACARRRVPAPAARSRHRHPDHRPRRHRESGDAAGGRLREPLDTCIAADAIIAADDDVEIDVAGMEMPMFRTRRTIGAPAGFTGGARARFRSTVRRSSSASRGSRRRTGSSMICRRPDIRSRTRWHSRTTIRFPPPTCAAFVAAPRPQGRPRC